MLRIDAHQHFWNFDAVRDSWITDEMAAIRKDFLPGDLGLQLEQNGFHGSVVVQSDQSEKENEFQLGNAATNDFVRGVVGWINLQSENVEERLIQYTSFRKMKGFRHVLQTETARDFMLRPAFMNGIRQLGRLGFTYDILIFADQLRFIPQFVSAFPDQRFVIDHIAKPDIRHQRIQQWSKDIAAVARYDNVYCKISGMVTEADWQNWKQADFVPFMDVVIESFGPNRIMFGSDWPVCLVAGSYQQVLGIAQEYFSSFSPSEQELFFGGNAVQFYNLETD